MIEPECRVLAAEVADDAVAHQPAQVEHRFVPHLIDRLVPHPLRLHQADLLQHAQVLGDRRLREPQLPGEAGDVAGPFAQPQEQPDPRLVRQRRQPLHDLWDQPAVLVDRLMR